jgi:hypothetical protein
MVDDFVKAGMRKESREEARGLRDRAGMVEDPLMVSLVGEVVMRARREGKSRVVVGMVEGDGIGDGGLETMMSRSWCCLFVCLFVEVVDSLLKLLLKLGVVVDAGIYWC